MDKMNYMRPLFPSPQNTPLSHPPENFFPTQHAAGSAIFSLLSRPHGASTLCLPCYARRATYRSRVHPIDGTSVTPGAALLPFDPRHPPY